MVQYVVVKDVLDAERLATIRRGCEIAIREMVGRDDGRVGNRGSHRYSFGAAPAHFGLQKHWSVLIDPPPLMEVMEAIFGTKDFVTNSGSGGGDFNIPGSVEYQRKIVMLSRFVVLSVSLTRKASLLQDSSPSQLNVPVCRGCGTGGCALATNVDQPIIFGCLDY